GEVGHVDLVGDRPEAEVAQDLLGAPFHPGVAAPDPQARDPILLQLVEERPPRPRARKRRALDLDHGVEVRGPHPLNADGRHAGAAPERARLRTAGRNGARAGPDPRSLRAPADAAPGRPRWPPRAGGNPGALATRRRRGPAGGDPRGARPRPPRTRWAPRDPGPAPGPWPPAPPPARPCRARH